MKIGSKLAMAVSVLLAVAVAVLGIVTYASSRQELQKSLLAQMEQDAGQKAMRVLATPERVMQDLLFMTEAPTVLNMLRACERSGSGQVSSTAYEEAAGQMQQLFTALLKNKPDYWQIRYIDEYGWERARADLVAGRVNLVTGDDLQNKADQPYFPEAMKLPPKAVYISPMNLNRERGKIEVPHKPTIRFATPLFGSHGSRRGILVINLDGGAMLARFTADVGNLYLVNQDGYFLKHPDSGKQFGFDLGHDHRLKDVHPRLADQLKKVDEIAEYWGGEGESEMRPHVHGFKKLYYDPRHQEAFWALVFDVPAAAFAVLDTLRWTFAWLGLLIAVLGGVAALLFSQRFSKPLATLAAAAERVAASDLTVDTPADGREPSGRNARDP